jgi:histidinol-phosphate aminotransferase
MFSDALAALPAGRPGYVPPGDDVVKLNQNECPYTFAPDEWECLLAALRAVPLNRYPDPGHCAVESAIAERSGLPPEMTLAGNGANELIELLIRSTCNPGDEVLTVAPTYHLYDRFCAMNGARLVKVPWGPDFEFPRLAVLGALSPRTRLILLCRPNNPSGHLYALEEVRAVAQACGGLVAVDEAYHDFAGDTLTPYLRTTQNMVVVRTLSKAYGAAGLRFGYLLAAAEVVRVVRRLQMPYGLGALTQAAALFLLTHPEIMERQRRQILAGREDLTRRLGGVAGLTLFPSSANFVLVRTASSADALDRHLRSRRIVVRNLRWDDRYLRVSVGTPEDHAHLVDAIEEFQRSGARAS